VHAHESEFRRSHTEVAKTEGDVIESEFGDEPSALRIRRKELTTGVKSMSRCWLRMSRELACYMDVATDSEHFG
jgi:hypothetical protein